MDNIVGNIFYREAINHSTAVMSITKFENGTYYRDVWGINRGENYILYLDDDILKEELNYIFNSTEYIIKNINNVSSKTKYVSIDCLFKSKIENRSR